MVKIRKGLFIGVDYVGTSDELYNCGNDARDMYRLLNSKFGIDEHIMLIDKVRSDDRTVVSPTKNNIMSCIRWLTSDLHEGDIVWLHYSGHGSYIKDNNIDETDGQDETLVPLDYRIYGQITDDEINRYLCKPVVEAGATLYFHDDCCHSGTGADLRYTLKQSTAVPEIVEEHIYDPLPLYGNPYYYFYYGAMYGMTGFWNKFMFPYIRNSSNNYRLTKHKKVEEIRGKQWIFEENYMSPELVGCGQVVKWSGCKDDQTSSDGFNGKANGAMTGSVITVLEKDCIGTWSDFISEIRKLLINGGFNQVPQLSFSKKIDITTECFNF